ncbi:peptidoglycan D,D-transpeptidase FtsI family protein [Paenibacillus crassostreae]|uniref:Penicillin-binding protein n=1 Tax=Paenibacillus crassostreae TaxID=1763538 RepID=A0A162RMA3_9BACL|nr:penicillin-binding transpeptidase domain-containing protein [Paenibacillus crassostreae]AOZ91850.1 hypothetical protein LPB68_06165 [Paenibacillus crassostreae]OAB73227.1 hypothetical protein PNBC_14125 [Paenibacillus crassostreae]
MISQQKKRIFYSLMLITACIAILVFRLAYIQFFMRTMQLPNSNHTLQEMSMLQRERAIVLDSGRGTITDRHGESLTGETIPAVVLFPINRDSIKREAVDSKITKIAESLGIDIQSFHELWQNLQEPMFLLKVNEKTPISLTLAQANLITDLNVNGIKVLPYRKRYRGTPSGMQWLGYLSQQPKIANSSDLGVIKKYGASGLEKTLEPLLKGVGPTVAYYTVDSRSNVLSDIGVHVKAPNNSYYPLRLTTTIDKQIQQQIERLTEQSGMKRGAVVVLDTNNADIVAMVSAPFYNPMAIDPEQGEWNNKALQAAIPGSIFKTVIAAAALEAGVTSPNEEFHCNGHYGRYGLSCWKDGGHGKLTLEQAYAKSCNVVFATLAERLNSDQITRTARALGVGRRIGWKDHDVLGYSSLIPLDHEETGEIFASSTTMDGGVRAQTGIGQRDVTMTPLQAANMVVTLLHGGQVQTPRILERISYHNGQVMQILKPHAYPKTFNSIQPATAKLLCVWMRRVVTDGTGQALSRAKWTLAGKSGTAQVILKGSPKNNQWFIGYGPVEQPKYAVAVLFQNVDPDVNNKATALFGQIMGVLSSVDGVSATAG